MPFMKSVVVSLTMLLLIAVSSAVVLGFSSSSSFMPNAAASPTTMNATTPATPLPITPTIELGEEPFAVGRYTPVSQTMINETQQLQIIFEGSTTITLPNTTESITTRDRGEGIITFLPGGGVLRGQLHLTTEDGSETATADITQYFLNESPTTISLVYFSTNSTGMLAPLNQMIAVSLGEQQPNGDSVSRGFEWKRGNAAGGAGAASPPLP